MDFIVLDWTRMGRTYCLAGAIVQAGEYRIVRPQSVRCRSNPVPNQGWSPYHFDGHTRWQRFEMVKPEPGPGVRPHLEDVWVSELKPGQELATVEERRAILRATLTPPGKPLFGTHVAISSSTPHVQPGTGDRSLTTISVPSAEIHFTALWREGAPEPDYRVSLPLPGLDRRILPVKDHFLLCRAEAHSQETDPKLAFMNKAIQEMGATVAVRLGLSRPYAHHPDRCWVMADGFFSLDDPQP